MKALPILKEGDSLPAQQADFRIDYVWVALAASLFVGFAVGAHVASIIGFDFPLGKGFYSFIQAHGHVQLIGWVGLLILGISLHFMPRLAGIPLKRAGQIDLILWLVTTGLVLRGAAQCIIPYLEGGSYFSAVNWLNALSAVLELGGIVLYLAVIFGLFRQTKAQRKRPALQQVFPFFAMVLTGFLIYSSLNLVLVVQMVWQDEIIVNQAWNEFAIQTYTGLVLLPVAFAFSIRLFPLYLRLPPVDWNVRTLAIAYLAGLLLALVPMIPPIARLESDLPLAISNIGTILRGAVILGFVWKLDLLTRIRAPWTRNRVLHPGPERRPTRPGLPDYGEFGRFEWLVYAAYVWLVIGAVTEIISGVTFLAGSPLTHSSDAVRHIYLMGFISLLIFGMAARMIPGFMGKRRVANPGLVAATFWLGNLAAIARVVPLLIPIVIFDSFPWLVGITQAAFGLSGVIAMLAVTCLTINLWRTV